MASATKAHTPMAEQPLPPDQSAATATRQSDDDLKDALLAERQWARTLDLESMRGVAVEIRMLRQVVRDAFVNRQDDTVRQSAETLRRLLRERAIVPELADGSSADLEDGLSADLRRVLQRVGMEMGVDI